ncbi:histidine phosphatase family (branch 2) protein (macronuclear) [Tetrahymena thermophila SB210]|uniref:Histidine phosphatase family (Branch 2) protein n=1 Tax=Tetrahymena thermophila (strain SB210) TaxID=312017 RepID=A4VE17_TETTS|nr:histidine phosphatase family (branch 2) protein [Tetrahymena thermophila SB210]EDK31768.2 histidine phosphatase family (branch 2) protein [Tetrahymena thermophila SB210]|eukprot:XP_001471322.2 histidine phosphatase family (branch 2) protein [Tetrahymena thermophila SB210]
MQKDAMGELSEVGIRQLYELGRIMRLKYVEQEQFISEKFKHQELFIRSTDKSRTLTSAQSFLQGLYPQDTGPQIPQNIADQTQYLFPPHERPSNFKPYKGSESIQNRIQPIPIHTVEFNRDKFLLNAESDCWKLESIRKQYQEIEMNKQINFFQEELNQFLKIVQDKDLLLDMVQIHKYIDGLICNEFNGLELPKDWKENKQFQKKMKDIYTLVFHLYYFGNEEATRLSITPYFKQIMKFIDDKINLKQPIKYYALFTHDVTIVNILNALKLASWQCIKQNIINNQVSPDCVHYDSDFASDILLEVRYHKSTQQYIVVTLFNGEVIELKRGQKYLSLDEFRNILLSQIVDDYDQICQQGKEDQQDNSLLAKLNQFNKEFSLFSNSMKNLAYSVMSALIILFITCLYLLKSVRQYQKTVQSQKKVD